MADDETNPETPPENEEPSSATFPPSVYIVDEVARFAHYFGKPVAVQLREPYVGIESTYDDSDGRIRPVTSGGCGWPRLSQLRDKDGNIVPEVAQVFFGSVGPSEDGRSLIIQRVTPGTGSRTHVTVHPDVIHSVTLITEPGRPPEEGRIIRPVK